MGSCVMKTNRRNDETVREMGRMVELENGYGRCMMWKNEHGG